MFLAPLLKIQLPAAAENRSSSRAAERRLVEQSHPNDLGSGVPRQGVSHVEEDFMMPPTTFKALFAYLTEKQSNRAILFYFCCHHFICGANIEGLDL